SAPSQIGFCDRLALLYSRVFLTQFGTRRKLSRKLLCPLGSRPLSVDVAKAVFLGKFSSDEPLPGLFHDVGIARQRRDSAADELRALTVAHVEMRRRLENRFRSHQPGIQRYSGDVMFAQLMRHARGHAII